MKNHAIYKNLDTSFVNLPALIKYLRREQFVGNIRVELNGYEADVTFSANEQLRVREYDRVAGRISEDEDSLQRLLIRARAPGGIINVYQEIEESVAETVIEEIAEDVPLIETRAPIVEEVPVLVEAASNVVNIVLKPTHQNGNSKKTKAATSLVEEDFPRINSAAPKLSFEFSNKFENKARQNNLDPQDWQMLLNVTAELLDTIDKTLAEANLEFAAAFEKARAEIADDYPFLKPSAGIFSYKNGKIIVREQINSKLFAASINESLRRILEKLGKNPKFLNIYLTVVQKIIILIEQRKPLYDKFCITPRLARTIGI